MGHCYEFGIDIIEGCGHAMTVNPNGSACECPTCGAHCPGRFAGCSDVLEQPGYVPVTAPRWAVERTAFPTPTLFGSAHDDEIVIDLTAVSRATRPSGTSSVAVATEVVTEVAAEPADQGRLIAELRRQLATTSNEHRVALDRLAHQIGLLIAQVETDHQTLKAVIEGLDRLARKISTLSKSS